MNNSRTSNYKPFSKIDESITDFRMKSIFLKTCSKMDFDVWAATCDTLAETSVEKNSWMHGSKNFFRHLYQPTSHVAAQTSVEKKKILKAWNDFTGSWAPMIARSNHRTLFIIFIFYPFLNALFDKVKKWMLCTYGRKTRYDFMIIDYLFFNFLRLLFRQISYLF